MDLKERERDFLTQELISKMLFRYETISPFARLTGLESKNDCVLLIGVFKGEIEAQNTDTEINLYELTEQHYQLIYPANLFSLFSLNQPTEIFRLYIPCSFLLPRLTITNGITGFLREQIIAKKPFTTKEQIISSECLEIIKTLEELNQTDDIHNIIMEAKTLELLGKHLYQLSTTETVIAKNSIIKEYDIEKVYQARNIIESNLKSPCSLIELSRKVGLNDFKLKKGFKEIMGNTVFGYLYECRMKKAHQLLNEKNSVNEVAFAVGYKNAQHFTAAYKKKFGFLPSSINK